MMLTCFFDSHNIAYYEYALEGQTINKEYYLELLRRLRDAMQRKRPDIWIGKNWQLHHDNAPAHSANANKSFWPKTIPHLCDSLLALLIWHHATSGYIRHVKNYAKRDAISVT